MADWDKNAFGSARPRHGDARGRGVSTAVRLLGAATSVALILGLGVWSYQLAMRQLHGLPVIKAPEGLARIAPDKPGGELAEHQGMAVNTIAALGEAADTAETLRLAPAPQGLQDEDTASDALEASLGSPLAAPDTPAPPAAADDARGQVRPSETMAALQQKPGQLTEPLPEGAVDPIIAPDLAGVEAGAMLSPEDLVPADVPGVAASPRPLARPVGDAVAEAAALAVAAAMAPEAAEELDPASLTPGTQLAQIGSYETEAQAKLEWDKATVRFGALMEGKQRVIQAAESGGRTFFRLRVAGFASRDEARRFCAALKSGGQCVPAEIR